MADAVTSETDEFDQALVRGLMRGVWGAAVGSVVLAVLSGCCGVPVLGAVPSRVIAMGLAFLAGLSAALSAIRLGTMPPQFRAQVSGAQLGGALAVAALGALLAALQLLGSVIWLLLF